MNAPTPNQRKVLARLAEGWVLMHYQHTNFVQNGFGCIVSDPKHTTHERVNVNTFDALHSRGWIERGPGEDRMSKNWRISDAGRAALG